MPLSNHCATSLSTFKDLKLIRGRSFPTLTFYFSDTGANSCLLGGPWYNELGSEIILRSKDDHSLRGKCSARAGDTNSNDCSFFIFDV